MPLPAGGKTNRETVSSERRIEEQTSLKYAFQTKEGDKMKIAHSLLAAAVGGILVGCGGANQTPAESAPLGTAAPASTTASPAAVTTSATDPAQPTPATAATKHSCKGQNDCKGQGGCKSS